MERAFRETGDSTMHWLFFLFGWASLTGQILLVREILVVFHGTEISIGIFFAAWLAGIGVGASLGSWWTRKTSIDLLRLFLLCFSALGVSIIAQIVLIRLIPSIAGVSPAELSPLRGIIVAAIVGTCSTSLMTGFLFPVGCRAIEIADASLISGLYGYEALGSLAGGITFTLILVHVLPPLQIAAVSAVILAIGALIQGVACRYSSVKVAAGMLLLVSLALLSPLGRYFDHATIRLRWESLHPNFQLVASESTPYQQVEIARLGNQFSLFGNGRIVASFPDPYTADRLAALIMAQHPHGEKILLIGGGVGSLLNSLTKYPIRRLDVVEPDIRALEIARSYMTGEESASFDDPRVRIIHGDGRFVVNRLGAREYDTIISMIPDPVSSFWNRYFTREYFESVHRALGSRGLFVTAVTSSENYWGAETASYAGSVYHTLREVFPSVKGTPGDVTCFFASQEQGMISLDAPELEARYRKFEKQIYDVTAFRTILVPERVAFVRAELERSPALINTDFSPISSSLAMILWGRFSGAELLEVLNTIRRGGLKVYLIPLAFFLIARISFRIRWGPRDGLEARSRSLTAMLAVGAAAMGFQVILIYSYQSLFGHVFERIGLIAALFMTGLAAGAIAGARFISRVVRKEAWILAALVCFAGLCLALVKMLDHLSGRDPAVIESSLAVLVLFSGLLTGAAFPLVASRHFELSRDAGATSGWTDATDHVGAALGALLTGTLLVPLLGTAEACVILAAVLLVPAALILAESIVACLDAALDRYRPRKRPSFPYVRLSWCLTFLVAAAFVWNIMIGPPRSEPIARFAEPTLKSVSGSETFDFVESPFPHYVGKSASETARTYTFSTMPLSGDIPGYGGPINLIVSVSEAGEIRGLGLAESRETPSYIKGIDQWLAQFKGRSILKPQDQKVDALTGATITAKAVCDILSKSGRRIAKPLLGLQEMPPVGQKSSAFESAFKDVKLFAVIFVLIYFLVAFYSRSRLLRLSCLAVSFLLCGVYLNAPFSELDVAALFRGQMPATGTLWRNTLFVATLMIGVLWGQAFCGFLCPFGAAQELCHLKRCSSRASVKLERAARYLKFSLLAALLCLFLVSDENTWFYFSPLQHAFSGKAEGWILALILLILAASVFYFRFWCRYLCPVGAFFALFNKVAVLGPWSPAIKPAKCDLGVTSSTDVDCIRCHRCLFEPAPKNTHSVTGR